MFRMISPCVRTINRETYLCIGWSFVLVQVVCLFNVFVASSTRNALCRFTSVPDKKIYVQFLFIFRIHFLKQLFDQEFSCNHQNSSHVIFVRIALNFRAITRFNIYLANISFSVQRWYKSV